MNDPIRTDARAPTACCVATIDMPGRTMNVFSADLMDALDALMDRVDADPAVRSVVVTSGKPSFLAGADLVMVRGYCDARASLESRADVRAVRAPRAPVRAPRGLGQALGRRGQRPRARRRAGARARLPGAARGRRPAYPARRAGGALGPAARRRRHAAAAAARRLRAGDGPAAQRPLDRPGRLPCSAGIFARAVPASAAAGRGEGRGARRCTVSRTTRTRKFATAATSRTCRRTARRRPAPSPRRHGVGAEDFSLYPAYSAIVDSVLKGARLPLAEATAVEMDQFLRLMFSPVAGRMVRTLFLERLARRTGARGAGRRGHRAARPSARSAPRAAPGSRRSRKVKLPQVADDALPADTLATDRPARRLAIAWRSRVLDEAPVAADAPLAVLAPAGPYGRVLEIVGADDATAAALAALATRLRSLPWRTPGPTSVLQRLRGQDARRSRRAIARQCSAQPRCRRPGVPRRRGLPRRRHAGVDRRTAELARGPSGDVIDRSRIGYHDRADDGPDRRLARQAVLPGDRRDRRGVLEPGRGARRRPSARARCRRPS